MELLQKALFNLPRVNESSGIRPALDKIPGLSHYAAAIQAAAAMQQQQQLAAAAAAAGNGVPPHPLSPAAHHPPPPPPASLAPPPVSSSNGPLGPLGPSPGPQGGAEPVTLPVVHDVASLILYGSQAIPIRLKILLDRLFSVLGQPAVVEILKRFGWTMDDYQRGYALKDQRGQPLERWQMCTKEEEHMVLQHFLRFGETRSITQQLIFQELSEKQDQHQGDQQAKAALAAHRAAQSELKKFQSAMAQNMARAAAAAASMSPNGLPPPGPPVSRGGDVSPRSHPRSSPMHDRSITSPSSNASSAVSPGKRAASPVNGAPSPMGGGSPLSRLQGMQPFDYRKNSTEAKTPNGVAAVPIPPTIPPMRMPGAAGALGPFGPGGMLPYGMAKAQEMRNKVDAENSHSALNLTSGPITKTTPSGLSKRDEGPPRRQKAASPPVESEMMEGFPMELKKKMKDNIGISFVNPQTGKKRVQCNVCLKTFCDKGALKIHFSAVHLREMHKCSVEGCNMMFSSRRSRNRHSANPNPKLHTPHLRRKISPHDGRSHQGPQFLGNLLAGGCPPPPVSPPPPAVSAAGPKFPALPGGLGANFAAAAAAGAIPPHLLTPELLQRQKMELQRLQESMQFGGFGGSDASEAKRPRLSGDSDENDLDEKSTDAQSTKDGDAASSNGNTSQAGGRQRKSRNPTRIPAGAQMGGALHPDGTHAVGTAPGGADDDEFSSDDDEEGFENPMDDNDDDLEDDEDRTGPGAAGPGDAAGGDKDHHHDGSPKEDNRRDGADDGGSSGGGGENHTKDKQNGDRRENEDEHHHHNVDKVNNNNDDGKKDLAAAAEEAAGGQTCAEHAIPVDKENPLRCVECDTVFENHFGLKQHYQNDHLKLLHKCNVGGCNAGFPSKRSRDRHSSNLNLHRKLLSCSSGQETTNASADFSVSSLAASAYNGAAAPDILARLYAEQQAMLFSQMQNAGATAADFQKMVMGGSPFAAPPPPPPPPVGPADSAGGSASPASTTTSSMPNSPELKVKPLGMLTAEATATAAKEQQLTS